MAKTNSNPDAIPAVIYARYSSSGQREESIEGQIRECRAFAEKNNLVIIGEYIDKALTGRTDKRPDFQRMIKDSERGVFKVVLCWKMDRFARNRYDSSIYRYRLKKNGVRILYAMESIPEGPEGIILESVMEGYAEYYSENLSQNVKRGLYDSALECKTLGRKVLGFRKGPDGRFETDPSSAETVRRIFRDYSSGIPSKQIRDNLNAEGFRNSCGRPFTLNNINKIIRDRRYIGFYIYQDICIEGGVPAIVDRELFDKCNAIADVHRHSPAAGRDVYYMLTSKLRCGRCGGNMTGESASNHAGVVYNYYTCNNRKKTKKCDAGRIRKDLIEDTVVSLLIDLVHNDAFIDEIADRILDYQEKERDTTMLDSLNARLKDVERRKNNLIAAMEAGAYTDSTRSRLMDLEKETEDLKKGIAKELISQPDLDRDQILFFFYKIKNSKDTASEEYRQMLIDTFLESVYLYDDKIVLTLNYSGKNNKVTKPLIEKALESVPSAGSSSNAQAGTATSKANIPFSVFVFEMVLGVVVPFSRECAR